MKTGVEVQTCLVCEETEARCEKEVERLSREMHYLEQEKEQALQQLQVAEFHNRRLERDNYHLRTKNEEPLSKRSAREHAEIREWLEAWNERRLKIPGARPVKDTTLGPESSNAKLVRKARGVWSHDEMMECIRGASISDWWTAELSRFKVAALIGDHTGKRDEKIQGHIDRWRDYQRLWRDVGFSEEFARRQVQGKRPPMFSVTENLRCPECGGVVTACFCEKEAA